MRLAFFCVLVASSLVGCGHPCECPAADPAIVQLMLRDAIGNLVPADWEVEAQGGAVKLDPESCQGDTKGFPTACTMTVLNLQTTFVVELTVRAKAKGKLVTGKPFVAVEHGLGETCCNASPDVVTRNDIVLSL